mmetsp:Transcript_39331/g.77007  ORF Transcript_39331/g.77007 Transcript_39331/m.77007 type:complete len:317 (-) Transcript_39331:170-1120(-)
MRVRPGANTETIAGTLICRTLTACPEELPLALLTGLVQTPRRPLAKVSALSVAVTLFGEGLEALVAFALQQKILLRSLLLSLLLLLALFLCQANLLKTLFLDTLLLLSSILLLEIRHALLVSCLLQLRGACLHEVKHLLHTNLLCLLKRLMNTDRPSMPRVLPLVVKLQPLALVLKLNLSQLASLPLSLVGAELGAAACDFVDHLITLLDRHTLKVLASHLLLGDIQSCPSPVVLQCHVGPSLYQKLGAVQPPPFGCNVQRRPSAHGHRIELYRHVTTLAVDKVLDKIDVSISACKVQRRLHHLLSPDLTPASRQR